MKYGYVILHYLTDDDTIECVNSILQTDNNNYEIVIVDNYSNNGSIERIEKKFLNLDNIHIIKNKKNLGFAKGNNIGYKYCRNILKCNNIIISNNDIIIRKNNIIDTIINDIDIYQSAVIGPDIESLVDGGHQNPMEINSQGKLDVIKDIIRYKILLIINFLNIYDFLKPQKKCPVSKVESNITSIETDVQLHGSFLIFTNLFVEKMEEAFSDETFLYMEETILKKICDKNNLKMIYDPNIKVFHKEDSSTNKLNNSSKKKRKFVFNNLIKSYRVLLKYL